MIKLFQKEDKILAVMLWVSTLAFYIYTSTPNIGMGDEGEMSTAALQWGVPHPSGYPLWTILAGTFAHLFPFGNGSWKLCVFSALCTSSALAVSSLILTSTFKWLGIKRNWALGLSALSTLTVAVSETIWSQANIGKGTYSLHLLLMTVYLFLCYRWVRTPKWKQGLTWVVFLFALSMSNHHMTLAMAVLPLVIIFFLYRERFPEYAVYSLITASIFYFGFGILSEMPEVQLTARRLLGLSTFSLIGLIIFNLIKKKPALPEWKVGVLLPIVVAIGLLPYAYMPIASSTNPPMNWSFCSTKSGFFRSINRSQYWGPLHSQLQTILGKIVFVKSGENPPTVEATAQCDKSFGGFVKMYISQLYRSNTIIPFLLAIAGILLIRRLTKEQKIWFILLIISFLLNAFLQALSHGTGTDNQAWFIQRPWQGFSYMCFLLIAFTGLGVLIKGNEKKLPLIASGLSLLLLYTGINNYHYCNQRGHWYGWMFGTDMLKDLPKGAVFYGGTDAGRFVPTYMIFCESKDKNKVDKDFDRSDLYIITQNAVLDRHYQLYIERQYTENRPKTFTALEKYLGRDTCYPKDNLTIPKKGTSIEGLRCNQSAIEQNSVVAEWIWKKNKENHRFFVEEMFPMPWAYDYAMPNHLNYEICKEKTKISKEKADEEYTWWQNYIKSLKLMPDFAYDEYAKRGFSKLLATQGNIYLHKKMYQEAERTYKQSLELQPDNTSVLLCLQGIYCADGRYNEAISMLKDALKLDPNCISIKDELETSYIYKTTAEELPNKMKNLFSGDQKTMLEIVQDQILLGKKKEAVDFIVKETKEQINKGNSESTAIDWLLKTLLEQREYKDGLEICKAQEELNPKNFRAFYTTAKLEKVLGNNEACIKKIKELIEKDPDGAKKFKKELAKDPFWGDLKSNQNFVEILDLNEDKQNNQKSETTNNL